MAETSSSITLAQSVGGDTPIAVTSNNRDAPGYPKDQKTGGASPPKNPKFKSGLQTLQGKQVIKGYSVTEDQLETLATLSLGSSILISIATFLIGFALNLKVTIDLSPGAPSDKLNFWYGVEWSCFLASLVFGVFGLALAIMRWKKTTSIKSKTKFASE